MTKKIARSTNIKSPIIIISNINENIKRINDTVKTLFVIYTVRHQSQINSNIHVEMNYLYKLLDNYDNTAGHQLITIIEELNKIIETYYSDLFDIMVQLNLFIGSSNIIDSNLFNIFKAERLYFILSKYSVFNYDLCLEYLTIFDDFLKLYLTNLTESYNKLLILVEN